MEERSSLLTDENDHLKNRIRQLEEAIAQCQNLLSFKSSQLPLTSSIEESSQTLLDGKHGLSVFGDEALSHLDETTNQW